MTTLRSDIAYIKSLKHLIDDSDAGLVDKKEFGEHEYMVSVASILPVKNSEILKKVKPSKKNNKPVKEKVKAINSKILDTKWKNYSPRFFENKFSIPKDINGVETLSSEDRYQMVATYQNTIYHPLSDMTTFNIVSPYDECSPSPTS